MTTNSEEPAPTRAATSSMASAAGESWGSSVFRLESMFHRVAMVKIAATVSRKLTAVIHP